MSFNFYLYQLVVKNSQGKTAQATKLYEILQTKVNSYEALKEALLEATQTGAFEILNEFCDAKSERDQIRRQISIRPTTDCAKEYPVQRRKKRNESECCCHIC